MTTQERYLGGWLTPGACSATSFHWLNGLLLDLWGVQAQYIIFTNNYEVISSYKNTEYIFKIWAGTCQSLPTSPSRTAFLCVPPISTTAYYNDNWLDWLWFSSQPNSPISWSNFSIHVFFQAKFWKKKAIENVKRLSGWLSDGECLRHKHGQERKVGTLSETRLTLEPFKNLWSSHKLMVVSCCRGALTDT